MCQKSEIIMKPIAEIHTDFPTKFGIPRQGNLIEELKAEIVFHKEFQNPEAIRGLEEFSHIWLIWGFSANVGKEWSPTVRPPRLGGNKRMGVFATRSPFRPNPLGLSLVKLEGIEKTKKNGMILRVSGADLMDKTPIYDIKPYLPHIEALPDATGGFAVQVKDYKLTVSCDEKLLNILPKEKRQALLLALAEDPRPSYQKDEERIYGFLFAGFEVKFQVIGTILHVREIAKSE